MNQDSGLAFITMLCYPPKLKLFKMNKNVLLIFESYLVVFSFRELKVLIKNVFLGLFWTISFSFILLERGFFCRRNVLGATLFASVFWDNFFFVPTNDFF